MQQTISSVDWWYSDSHRRRPSHSHSILHEGRGKGYHGDWQHSKARAWVNYDFQRQSFWLHPFSLKTMNRIYLIIDPSIQDLCSVKTITFYSFYTADLAPWNWLKPRYCAILFLHYQQIKNYEECLLERSLYCIITKFEIFRTDVTDIYFILFISIFREDYNLAWHVNNNNWSCVCWMTNNKLVDRSATTIATDSNSSHISAGPRIAKHTYISRIHKKIFFPSVYYL